MRRSELQHEGVRAAFNAIAPDFDVSLENPTTAAFREEIYRIVTATIRPGDSVLDINCGTGIDAAALAGRGFRVVGADISPGMLREAAKKAANRSGLRLEFLESSFDDLSVLSGRSFDLVLSNFGGLNCTDTPEAVFERVAAVTRPGGWFIVVFMPRVSLWEIVAGLARFDFRTAIRRMRMSAASTGFRGKTFPVFYFTVRTILHRASRWFAPRSIRGVWVISPPPHAESFRRRFPRLSVFLTWVDQIITGFPFLRAIGDHVMILFERFPAEQYATIMPPEKRGGRPWVDMVSEECHRLAAGETTWDDHHDFAALLAGKRVVVVGPARTLAGKGRGPFIDSFDLVVRLNESAEWILGNRSAQSDYGSRTDILYSNQSVLRTTFVERAQNEAFVEFCRSGQLRHIVCTNNSLDFNLDGAPTKTCRRSDRNTIRDVERAIRSIGSDARLRVVRSASEWSMRMLRGHWGRTGFIAIVDLLGFPVAHVMVMGMTFYHGGGHVLAEGVHLHPLGNRNGVHAKGPAGAGHQSFLEADIFRALCASFTGRISFDEGLSNIITKPTYGESP